MLLLSFLFILFSVIGVQSGTFWQITDIHLDRAYDQYGDTNDMCHNTSGGRGPNVGYFGNFSCDAPWTLVADSIAAMKKLHPNPDFILWTGDNVPHIWTPEPSWDEVFEAMKRITDLLMTTFPSVPIIPVLGNHDTRPTDQFPSYNKTFYTDFLTKAAWDKLIPPDQQKTFITGGYFGRDVGDLRMIVLNNNLYYSSNNLSNTSDPDPSFQFQWLKTQLKIARDQKKKVLISSHVPPGFFERVNLIPFLYPDYNNYLVNLTLENSDVILTHIYGHEHTDSFRIFAKNRKEVTSTAFLAPSVTPLAILNSPEGVRSGVNPSVRLYQYDADKILDYFQYYLNLSSANANGTGAPSGSNWKLLYRATEAYSLPDLSVSSLVDLYVKFTDPSSEEFEKYYFFNTAGAAAPPCTPLCWQSQICAIAHLTERAMSACWNTSDEIVDERDWFLQATRDVKRSDDESLETNFIVITTLFVAGVVILVALFLCVVRVKNETIRYKILRTDELVQE